METIATSEGLLTGIPDIDLQLVGGIRGGSLVLIEGPPDSGKSVLTQHFVHHGLRTNKNAAVYYSTEHNVKGLMAQMASISLHTLDNLLADTFRVYPLCRPISPREALKAVYLLNNHISRLPERFDLLVLDSVTPFVGKLSPSLKANFFHDCKKLCDKHRTIILVANSHIFEKETFPRISLMCDYHMTFNLTTIRFQADQTGERVICKMRIPKLHGADLNKKDGIRFEVEPGHGIQVIPFSKISV